MQEVVSKCKVEISKFIPEILKNQKIIEDFRNMKIDEDDKESRKEWKRDDVQYSLFKDLHQLERFELKGKEWIGQEYFEELSELLEKYPKHHSTII